MVRKKNAKQTQPAIDLPETAPIDLQSWHGVNWLPIRAELAASGDHEGLAHLDAVLPNLHRQPYTPVIDGCEVQTTCRRLTASALLDWLRDRGSALRVLDELAPAMALDTSPIPMLCKKWFALAAWTRRFELRRDGRECLGCATGIGRDLGGLPSPFRTWVTELRTVTIMLLDHVVAPLDVAIHRLVQDLDDVLAGHLVDVRAHLRDVDLAVRTLTTRARVPLGSDRQRQQRGRPKTRRHLSDMAILVLRALPEAKGLALPTLHSIAARVEVAPRPSTASMSRAVRELREATPPLADSVSYKRTKAGDREAGR